jgi:hypothetical protein
VAQTSKVPIAIVSKKPEAFWAGILGRSASDHLWFPAPNSRTWCRIRAQASCCDVIVGGIVALRCQLRGLAGAMTLSPSPLRCPPLRRYLGGVAAAAGSDPRTVPPTPRAAVPSSNGERPHLRGQRHQRGARFAPTPQMSREGLIHFSMEDAVDRSRKRDRSRRTHARAGARRT